MKAGIAGEWDGGSELGAVPASAAGGGGGGPRTSAGAGRAGGRLPWICAPAHGQVKSTETFQSSASGWGKVEGTPDFWPRGTKAQGTWGPSPGDWHLRRGPSPPTVRSV